MNHLTKTKDYMKPMKSNYNERKITTESPDSVLLESALQTLKMIASSAVFKDSMGDQMIMANYRDLAKKEVELILHKQSEYRNYLVFGDEQDGYSDMEVSGE